ncbi:MAG: WYL domain-containing protein [Treponema sp.]|nr:WYL domain-containing protein [Treponema sp.]
MKSRKTLPKSAIPRIFFIDEEIASGKYPNVPYLAEKYETSQSSINRDINYMRDVMGAPIDYDYYKKGYFYYEKTFRLSTTYASAEDLLALDMAKSLMELYKDSPIHDAAMNLLESITVPLKNVQNSKWYKDRIIIPKAVTVPVDPFVWKCIVKGLQENLVITFFYQDAAEKDSTKYEVREDAKLKTRKIHPYQLLFDRSAWYLSGYDVDRKEKRMFALSRISCASATKEKFVLKANFDYRNSEGLSYFGVYAENKIYKFSIEITGDTRWISERQWAEDQKIQKTANGIKLSFTSNQFNKVMDFILSMTPRAKPIAPKILVDHWKAAIKEAGKLVKST